MKKNIENCKYVSKKQILKNKNLKKAFLEVIKKLKKGYSPKDNINEYKNMPMYLADGDSYLYDLYSNTVNEFIYFAYLPSRNAIKIGRSIRLSNRIKQLTNDMDKNLEVLGVIRCDGSLEKFLHKHFSKFRIEREFFKKSKQLLEFIDLHVKKDMYNWWKGFNYSYDKKYKVTEPEVDYSWMKTEDIFKSKIKQRKNFISIIKD